MNDRFVDWLTSKPDDRSTHVPQGNDRVPERQTASTHRDSVILDSPVRTSKGLHGASTGSPNDPAPRLPQHDGRQDYRSKDPSGLKAQRKVGSNKKQGSDPGIRSGKNLANLSQNSLKRPPRPFSRLNPSSSSSSSQAEIQSFSKALPGRDRLYSSSQNPSAPWDKQQWVAFWIEIIPEQFDHLPNDDEKAYLSMTLANIQKLSAKVLENSIQIAFIDLDAYPNLLDQITKLQLQYMNSRDTQVVRYQPKVAAVPPVSYHPETQRFGPFTVPQSSLEVQQPPEIPPSAVLPLNGSNRPDASSVSAGISSSTYGQDPEMLGAIDELASIWRSSVGNDTENALASAPTKRNPGGHISEERSKMRTPVTMDSRTQSELDIASSLA